MTTIDTIATVANPIVTTTGLDTVAAKYAKAIRNARFQLLAVKPKVANPEGQAIAYVWRAVAKMVSPKEALQRAITKVFTKDLSGREIKRLDTIAEQITKAINDGIVAQEALAKMVKVEDEVESGFTVNVQTGHTYGMGLCQDCQECHHFWEVNRSGSNGNAPTSKGICLHCGKVGQFFNSIHSQIQARREALLDRELVDEVGVDHEEEEDDSLNALAMADAMNAMVDASF